MMDDVMKRRATFTDTQRALMALQERAGELGLSDDDLEVECAAEALLTTHGWLALDFMRAMDSVYAETIRREAHQAGTGTV